MVGLYTGPDPVAPSPEEQATLGQAYSAGLGASLSEGFADNITPRLIRSQGRYFAETGELSPGEFGGGQSPFAPQSEPTLDPAAANAQYGIKGVLNFDQPVPESVAQDLYEHHRDQLFREDTMARAGVGGVARFTTGIATSLLDPLSVASAFIPGVGEARAAEIFGGAGRAALEAGGTGLEGLSLAGRVGARAVAGGSAGLIGTTALQPIQGALAQQEHADYTMQDALLNLAMGTVMGGGLHVGSGAVADLVTGRYRTQATAANSAGNPVPIANALQAAGPETRETLLRGTIAQLAEGRQVDVAGAFDALQAGKARDELVAFAQQQARIEQESDALLAQGSKAEGVVAGRRAAASQAQVRLTSLQTEAEGLRSDLQRATEDAQFYSDPDTSVRLSEIASELEGVIPRARRASLEAERTMLQEGGQQGLEGTALEGQQVSAEQTAREIASRQAEAKALGTALARNEAGQRATAGVLGTAQGTGDALETAGNRTFQIQTARIASKQAVLQNMAERSVRRLAARLGVGLEEGEDTAIAQRVLSVPKAEQARVIADAVKALGEKRPDIGAVVGSEPALGDIAGRAAAPLSALQSSAATDLAERTKQAYQPSAERVSISRAAEAAAQDQRPDVAKLQAHIDELEAMGPEAEPEVAAARELTEAADAKAAAIEQAAACVARGI